MEKFAHKVQEEIESIDREYLRKIQVKISKTSQTNLKY